ncbi:AAEL012427-PA [Aedes aegypti]|uniref:AAEL012427-PA n=1 Tax=Aedes aegypti TaxID=7159 RepID=Q16M47_AEDAE|nr:AAEL012427-PA [Aedes aegypti]
MSSTIESSSTRSAIYRVNQSRTFYEFVLEQKNALASSVESISVDDATNQIELALSFMKHYMEQDSDGLTDQPECKHRVILDTRKSMFEILLDLHSSMRATCVGFNVYFTGGDPRKDSFVAKLLEFPNFENGADALDIPEINFEVSFCTMIVFDSSDLESATDVLAKAWENCSVPWEIRSLLVQETVQEKFIQLLESKLKPFPTSHIPLQDKLQSAIDKATSTGLRVIRPEGVKDSTAPAVVYGSSVDFFLPAHALEPSPVVVMNVFRTPKEAISLVNKSNGGSVSLWTEQLCLAMETAYAVEAQTVWVNTYARFNPAFPYSFRCNGYCYGSEYAVYEKKVKAVFIPSAENPKNSAEKNKAAISALGVVSNEVKNHRFAFVRNEKNVHYEVISTPYNIENYNPDHAMQIVEGFWDKYVSIDFNDRNLVLDTVHNQRKTVVIPYGVSFAN